MAMMTNCGCQSRSEETDLEQFLPVVRAYFERVRG